MDAGADGGSGEEMPVLDEAFLYAPAPREPSYEERRMLAELDAAADRVRVREELRAGWADAGRFATRQRSRRRWIFALVILAVCAVAAWLLVHGGSGRKAPQPAQQITVPGAQMLPAAAAQGGPTTTTVAVLGLIPGDCATWDQATGSISQRDIDVTSCSSRHLVEIVSSSGQLAGLGASWPGMWRVAAAASTQCAPLAERFLGYPVDPYGRFDVSAITPTEQEWGLGDRTMWCDMELAATTASPVPLESFQGDVRGAEQTFLQPAGTCESLNSDGSVPCNGPHVVEITGNVDLAGQVATLPSTPGEWESLVGGTCAQLGAAYLGGAYPPAVQSAWQEIHPSSWAAGTRIVQCFVARIGTAGTWATVDTPLRPTRSG